MYFSEQVESGRGERINDTVYIVINETDRRLFPELSRYFGVAITPRTTTAGEVQHWLFQSDSEFDEDVLAALSCATPQSGSGI